MKRPHVGFPICPGALTIGKRLSAEAAERTAYGGNMSNAIARNFLAATLALGISAVAHANCIQGANGATYTCGGSPAWNFETGKWTCVNPATGQTVSGEKVDCDRSRGRDAGTDDDLLEPLVPPGKGRPIQPGDPRKRIEQPK